MFQSVRPLFAGAKLQVRAMRRTNTCILQSFAQNLQILCAAAWLVQFAIFDFQIFNQCGIIHSRSV